MPIEMRSGRVISVDDNATNQKVVTSILSKVGYLVQQVMDGASALQIIRDQQPDLVLLDIMMPDMNGYEVIRAIKDDPKTAQIPVIFVTAKNQARDLQAGFEAGAADYVTKPFAFEELIARVNCQIDLLRQRSKLEQMQRDLEKLNGELFDYNIETTEKGAKLDRELNLARQKMEHYESALAEALSTSKSGVSRALVSRLGSLVEVARNSADFPRILRGLIREGKTEDALEVAQTAGVTSARLRDDLEQLLQIAEEASLEQSSH